MLFLPWENNFLQVLIFNLVEKIKQMHILFILTKFNSLFYHCHMMFLHIWYFCPFATTLTLGSQPRWRAQIEDVGQKNVLWFMHIFTKWILNIFKQESFWELKSQNVINVFGKNANGYIYGLRSHFTYNHYFRFKLLKSCLVPSFIDA
jgi:hypothetical protein